MERGRKWWCAAAGAAAGLVNGFFGGGGGMVLVPLLMGKCGLERKQALATSVAVIAPLCLVSSAIYLYRGGLDLGQALPYLVGGLVGGLASSRVMVRVPAVWLRRAFALVLLYGGVRALL